MHINDTSVGVLRKYLLVIADRSSGNCVGYAQPEYGATSPNPTYQFVANPKWDGLLNIRVIDKIKSKPK